MHRVCKELSGLNNTGASVQKPTCHVVCLLPRLQPPMTDFLRVLADGAPVRSLSWLLRHPNNRCAFVIEF